MNDLDKRNQENCPPGWSVADGTPDPIAGKCFLGLFGLTALAVVYGACQTYENNNMTRHNNLPSKIRPYDNNPADGILSQGELEKIAKDLK